jgi:hypothetical protein
MPKVQIRKSQPSAKTESSKRQRQAKKPSEPVRPHTSAGRLNLKTADAAPPPRTTKQDAVLTLLSHADGASVAELSAATSWQTHSVRGFLAGTVKKKLGFVLSSSKSEDGVRRYRIEPRRGR